MIALWETKCISLSVLSVALVLFPGMAEYFKSFFLWLITQTRRRNGRHRVAISSSKEYEEYEYKFFCFQASLHPPPDNQHGHGSNDFSFLTMSYRYCHQVYRGTWLSCLLDLPSLRVAGAVGARNYVKSSSSQWALRMIRTSLNSGSFDLEPSTLAIELSQSDLVVLLHYSHHYVFRI